MSSTLVPVPTVVAGVILRRSRWFGKLRKKRGRQAFLEAGYQPCGAVDLSR